MNPDYELANCEDLAALSPATFELLPAEIRYACKAGDVVKLIFCDMRPGIPGERMWVEITGSESNPWWQGDKYFGVLRNQPAFI